MCALSSLICKGVQYDHADATACRFSPDVRGSNGDSQLDDLLQDDTIDACIVVLPVQVMLQV